MTAPVYLPWPIMQDDICWETKKAVGPMLRAVIRARDYAEQKRPYDAHEVLYAMRNTVSALTALANDLESKMRETRNEMASDLLPIGTAGMERGGERTAVQDLLPEEGGRALHLELEDV